MCGQADLTHPHPGAQGRPRDRPQQQPAGQTLLEACLPAYYGSLASPLTAPHARFDVTEWMPLSE